jgi:hypothetical protein
MVTNYNHIFFGPYDLLWSMVYSYNMYSYVIIIYHRPNSYWSYLRQHNYRTGASPCIIIIIINNITINVVNDG